MRTSARLSVIAAGPLVTLQDAGRPGYRRFGVPSSGPLDPVAHAAANLAVGQPADATAVEVSHAGVILRCEDGAVTLGLAGVDVTAAVDERALPRGGFVVTVEAGQTIEVAPGPGGRWAYLAVAGQLEGHRWLASLATHAPSGLGGAVLRSGATIDVSGATTRREREGPVPELPRSGYETTPRIVLGPQQDCFGNDRIARLLDEPFVTTSAVDRMGLRLRGPDLTPHEGLHLPSEPAQRGALQVAGDGVPTLLLADHQTTGGYPKIATMLWDDVRGLAQQPPGRQIRFEAVTSSVAVAIARARAVEIERYLTSLARGTLSHRLRAHNLIDGVASATGDAGDPQAQPRLADHDTT